MDKKKKGDKEKKEKKGTENLASLRDPAFPYEIADKMISGEEKDDSDTRLLIIDDDEGLRSLLRDLLVEAGYTVDTASCGEEALKMIRVSTYDLVVTDLRMKGMHGFKVIKEVKSIDPGVDVIVITGYSSVSSAVESMKAGATDYITKPFNSDHIKMVVDKNMERRQFQRLASEREFYKALSNIDGLTELYNYRYFHQYLQMELEREKRYKRPFSLIMLDIDNFKEYNDRYGHPVGDLVLKNLATILRKTTRGSDVICRYGGEEFAVILPETSKQEAAIFCERIRTAVKNNKPRDLKGGSIGNIRVTVGLASFPKDADNKDELIEKTDKALYQGKEAGKNCTFLYGAKEKYTKSKKKTS